MNLPEHVQGVVNELAAESDVRQIWLIGSRGNETALPSSDWDLLVFAGREPNDSEARHANVDVIWRGPSRTKLEGGSIEMDFKNFQWADRGDGFADYVGFDFEPHGRSRPARRAVRLWAKDSKV